jgi:hypothetical protein
MNYLPYQDDARKWYPKNDFDICLEKYKKNYENTVLYFEKFLSENSARYPFPEAFGISLWEKLGRGKCPVQRIEWENENELSLFVGGDEYHRVLCKRGDNGYEIARIDRTEEPKPEKISIDKALPSVRGRKYLAEAEAAVRLPDGRLLVGTRDTMLAIVSEERVFSLGRVCTAGGIHSLALAPDGAVYGVAGHERGTGQLFKYTDEEGIELLGILPEVKSTSGRMAAIYRPSAVAVSPDGKYLAVGGYDEMGGAVVLRIG